MKTIRIFKVIYLLFLINNVQAEGYFPWLYNKAADFLQPYLVQNELMTAKEAGNIEEVQVSEGSLVPKDSESSKVSEGSLVPKVSESSLSTNDKRHKIVPTRPLSDKKIKKEVERDIRRSLCENGQTEYCEGLDSESDSDSETDSDSGFYSANDGLESDFEVNQDHQIKEADSTVKVESKVIEQKKKNPIVLDAMPEHRKSFYNFYANKNPLDSKNKRPPRLSNLTPEKTTTNVSNDFYSAKKKDTDTKFEYEEIHPINEYKSYANPLLPKHPNNSQAAVQTQDNLPINLVGNPDPVQAEIEVENESPSDDTNMENVTEPEGLENNADSTVDNLKQEVEASEIPSTFDSEKIIEEPATDQD